MFHVLERAATSEITVHRRGRASCERLTRSFCTIILAAVLASGSALPAAAQTFRGTILGTVVDQQGGAVAEAKVTAKNTGTGLERSTVTDAAGNFSIPELPIGTYDVTVQKSGFKPTRFTGVIVEVASERRLDVLLQVTGGAEAIEVHDHREEHARILSDLVRHQH